MKKTFKFIPLAIAPALLLMACANVASNGNGGLFTGTYNPSSNNTDNGGSGITEFTVTVDFNGGRYQGETTHEFRVRKDTKYLYFKRELPKAEDITYNDHTLDRYAFTSDASADPIDENYKFTGDITIYAIYTPTEDITYSVTWFNSDGETVIEEEQYHNNEMPSFKGETPQPVNPVEGITYKFVGWDPEEIVPINHEPQTYTAVYEEIITKAATITFDSNGGSIVPAQTLPVGSELAEPEKPTKPGYTFDMWKDGDEEVSFPYEVTEDDKTFVAQWTANDVDVAFDPDGGKWEDETTDIKTFSFKCGEMPYPDETPIRDGYIFVGWTPNLTPVTEEEIDPYKALWHEDTPPTQYYVVSFNTQGGSSVEAIQVAEGDKVQKPSPDPIKTGWDFAGWYTAAEGGDEWDFDNDTVSTNTILYAHWDTGTNVHTVKFHNNDGTTTFTSVDVRNGSCLIAPSVPTYTGHRFKGWYDAATGGSEFDFTVPFTKDTTTTDLYAQWDTETRTVTFDSQGGSSIAAKEVDYGATVADPGAPTYPGHDFNGWYTAKTGGTKWTFATDTVTSNITLYAQWGALKKLDVKFYDSDGTLLHTVSTDYGMKVTRPEDPIPEDATKVFAGWMTSLGGSDAFNFDDPITQATSAYASYTDKTSFTILWRDADYSILETDRNVAKGTTPTYDGATPEKAPDAFHRYAFKGWSPEILPAHTDMSYYATYDYDDEIAFSYESDSYALDDKFAFDTTITYGGYIVYSFDECNMEDVTSIRDNLTVSIDGGAAQTISQFDEGSIAVVWDGKPEEPTEPAATRLVIKAAFGTDEDILNAHDIKVEVIKNA